MINNSSEIYLIIINYYNNFMYGYNFVISIIFIILDV